MGVSKTEFFNDEQNKIALFSKLLANPARVAILQQLFEMDGCYCANLVEEVGLAQPTVSLHLKELRNIGLVKYKTEGKSVCYCIHTENWLKMRQVMMHFFNQDTAILQN